MNNRLLFCAVAALMAACTPKPTENQFQLKGSIAGVDGQEIYLMYESDVNNTVSDTTVINNGIFEFKGELNVPMTKSFLYMGDINERNNPNRCQVYLEPTAMTIKIDKEAFQTPTITGSYTQAESDTLMQQQMDLQKQVMALYEQVQKETDTDKREALKAQAAPLQQKMERLSLDFIKTHPNSFLAPELMRFQMSDLSYQEIKTIYNNWTDRVKQHRNVKDVETELAALEKIQPGMPAPEIRKEDVNGKEVSLSSLKGNVVLVDFWASWCVPCRKSFPHVKALYDKYHSKGFEVFCIASDDSSPDAWKKAIESDGLEKFYHVLSGLRSYTDENGRHQYDHSKDVSDKYAVHYLPTKYLIDREGNIIGKMNDEELDAKLKELFGF